MQRSLEELFINQRAERRVKNIANMRFSDTRKDGVSVFFLDQKKSTVAPGEFFDGKVTVTTVDGLTLTNDGLTNYPQNTSFSGPEREELREQALQQQMYAQLCALIRVHTLLKTQG